MTTKMDYKHLRFVMQCISYWKEVSLLQNILQNMLQNILQNIRESCWS